MLKYKWMCLVLACCTLFVACEPASTTSTQNPISFGAGRKNSAYNPDLKDGINATLWGYRTYNNTTTTVFAGVGARLYETDETESGYDLEIKSATQYWNIGTYQFYSVSPQLKNASITNNALTISDFDISSQTDILSAVSSSINVNKLEYNTPVGLTYNHLLTKIKFQAHAKAGSCIITEFKIQVPQTATYTHTNAWGTKSNSTWLNFNTSTTLSTTAALIDIDGEGNIDGWLVYPGIVADKAINYSISYKMSEDAKPITCLGELPSLINGGEAGKSYLYTLELMTSEIKFGGVTLVDWADDEQASIDISFKEN